MKRPRILLAQFNAADGYPPVLNQAALLAAQAEVTLLDAGAQDEPMAPIPGVQRVRVCWQKQSALRQITRLWARVTYARHMRALLKLHPYAVIGYEPYAIALMLLNEEPDGGLRVAHLHEDVGPGTYCSLVDKIALDYVRRSANRADLFIVADEHRGRLLKERWNLKNTPVVVRNCPRKLDSLPPSCLLPWLAERGVKPSGIVYFHGSIGPGHGLQDVVATMPKWPPGSIFVLVGGVNATFKGELERIAAGMGVADRLHFVGHVPHDKLFSYAVGADVGICLYNPEIEPLRFSTGASNKRFEYAALGIAQITNEAPGIQETFISKGVALSVPFGEREALGIAIVKLLGDPQRKRVMGERARALHIAEYNYEHEFAHVMGMIVTPASNARKELAP